MSDKPPPRSRVKRTLSLAIDCSRWNADAPELDRVPDHHPRFVVSMDPVDLSRDGIRHLNICDFLEEE